MYIIGPYEIIIFAGAKTNDKKADQVKVLEAEKDFS